MKERTGERVPILPELVVFCGPMFSGKSAELIKEMKRAPHAGYKVIAFKPEVDKRRGINTINSEDGGSFPATRVEDSSEILDLVSSEVDIVGIDETQFFDDGIVDVCIELVNRGKKVIVAGLDKNFKGEPFGPMATLKQEAEEVQTFQAYCHKCGQPASFTQRIVNGKPADYNEPVVVVGATELYEARCRKHHEVPGRPTKK